MKQYSCEISLRSVQYMVPVTIIPVVGSIYYIHMTNNAVV